MLFNSFVFLLAFLPVTLLVYFYLNSKRLLLGAKAWLCFASIFFYSYWDVKYLPLILSSIMVNFIIGSAISAKTENEKSVRLQKKAMLIIGIVFNVALLGYFKYVDFFIQIANVVLSNQMALLHVVLPIGISFFTFQQIAYLVDSYKGETKEYDFLTYSLFVTFFPQLIAGPIVHHKEMMPQFETKRNRLLSYRNIAVGMMVLITGLIKKVVIADNISRYANIGYNDVAVLSMSEAWFTSLTYTFQLYFDFSGYSDMAIGIGLMFNIKLPQNFNSPYKAVNIQDFWHRWHMTLSRWLKDYIYIPLGGNRGGRVKTCLNLFLTFLIGGFWHGAGWTFVIWGAMHGVAIVIHRLWSKLGFRLNRFSGWLITFLFVNFTWVFFRAKSFGDAVEMIKSMLGLKKIVLPQAFASFIDVSKYTDVSIGKWTGILSSNPTSLPITLLGLLLFSGFTINSWDYYKNKKSANVVEALVYMVLMLVCFHNMMINSSDFLYFNF